MTDLDKLRDELAEKFARFKTEFPDEYTNDQLCFKTGWNALHSHLTEAVGEFPKQAAIEQAKHEDSDGYFGFLTGAEWQFSQDAARIGLVEQRAIKATEHAIELGKQKMLLKDRLERSGGEFSMTMGDAIKIRAESDAADGPINKSIRSVFAGAGWQFEADRARIGLAEMRVKELEADNLKLLMVASGEHIRATTAEAKLRNGR